MRTIETFLSRPNWVEKHVSNQFSKYFYPLLKENGFNPRTIGKDVVPLSSPFQHVIDQMTKCECTIVLGLPQTLVSTGTIKGVKIDRAFSLATEWNQIEAAISITLNKPTLMMLHKGVAARGLFDRGAANVYVHEFDTGYSMWLDDMKPKLAAIREMLNA